jgi:hypothetical protein
MQILTFYLTHYRNYLHKNMKDITNYLEKNRVDIMLEAAAPAAPETTLSSGCYGGPACGLTNSCTSGRWTWSPILAWFALKRLKAASSVVFRWTL